MILGIDTGIATCGWALLDDITWCTLPDGHDGQCSGPSPRVIETSELGPSSGAWSSSRRKR